MFALWPNSVNTAEHHRHFVWFFKKSLGLLFVIHGLHAKLCLQHVFVLKMHAKVWLGYSVWCLQIYFLLAYFQSWILNHMSYVDERERNWNRKPEHVLNFFNPPAFFSNLFACLCKPNIIMEDAASINGVEMIWIFACRASLHSLSCWKTQQSSNGSNSHPDPLIAVQISALFHNHMNYEEICY